MGQNVYSTEESKVETAYIYQFTNYIEWPREKEIKNPGSTPFVISVVGNSPIIEELEKLAKTKTIKNRPIEIVAVNDSAKLKKCEIVVIAALDLGLLKSVCEKAKGWNTLIVSSAEGFAKQCSMVNFYLEDGRLRFEINRPAIENEKLVVSSQLLKLARLVE